MPVNNKKDTNSELYIDVRNSETRIAMLSNKRLVEFSRESNNLEFAVGNIYLGKVKKIVPGLNAAFIDIGSKKEAFLHYLDLGAGFLSLNKFVNIASSNKNKYRNISQIEIEPEIDKNGKISDVLTVGQNILVQVEKESISSKGPRLTCEISIAGRNVIILPFNPKNNVSTKIKLIEERVRLKKLLESITPPNYGVIIRTVAEKKMVAELDRELLTLVEKWESLFTILPKITAPKLVLGEVNRTSTFLRDMLDSSFSQITTNDKKTYEAVKEIISEISPDKNNIVKLYLGSEPIFDNFGIERQIKSAFGKIVPLKNGAYLIIEHTEAANIIDINSGSKFNNSSNQEDNALEVNLLAIEEIARQLKLRDIGGLIVIDFIDVHIEANKKIIYDKMKELLDEDKAKSYVLPLSKFCLMEITRQRVRSELNIDTDEICPACKGLGKVNASILLTDEIENDIKYFTQQKQISKILLKAHPFIIAYIKQGNIFTSLKSQWQKKYKCNIKLKTDLSYTYLEYYLLNRETEEELQVI